MKKYITILTILVIAEYAFSQRLTFSGKIAPPKVPSGVTVEDAFVHALKDPNIYIGVFEFSSLGEIMPSGEKVFDLPGFMEATHRFHPLRCVKPIKGKFSEPIIFYFIGGMPMDSGNNFFNIMPESKWILALEKTTKEYRVGRFGKDIEKYKFINDDTFFNILWYRFGELCLKWPESSEKPATLVEVNDSMVDDLIAIAKEMPSIEKAAKDPNGTAVISKISLSLKNDLAKSILEKVTEEKEETPVPGLGGFITNRR